MFRASEDIYLLDVMDNVRSYIIIIGIKKSDFETNGGISGTDSEQHIWKVGEM